MFTPANLSLPALGGAVLVGKLAGALVWLAGVEGMVAGALEGAAPGMHWE